MHFASILLVIYDPVVILLNSIEIDNMALSVLPYSTHDYNSLPNIMDAGNNLKSSDIDLLTKEIGQVFIKHGVEKLFGIILLHNHFSLEEDEMLVNIGSVAVPWKTSSLAQQLDDVKGSAWVFTKNGVSPYEFTYQEVPQPEVHHFQPFVAELAATLERLD